MITIRPLGARQLKAVLRLLEQFTDDDFEYSVLQHFQQLYGPIQRFSQMLPPRWQFVPAIYVAESNNKVLGLIWLSKDGKKESRWKIDQLIIDPGESTFDVGTQLVNYVINRYGGEGVQTFVATVHNEYQQALGLFKSCGFRHVTRAYQHQLAVTSGADEDGFIPAGLREATHADRFKLRNLHEESLPVDKRIPLKRSPRDFSQSLWDNWGSRLKGRFVKRWVIEDRLHDVLIASVQLSTDNCQEFWLDVFTSPGWEEGYSPLLAFALKQACLQSSQATLHLTVFSFQNALEEAAKAAGFERQGDAEVLVKDYWVPIQDDGLKLSSPILLFGGKPSAAPGG